MLGCKGLKTRLKYTDKYIGKDKSQSHPRQYSIQAVAQYNRIFYICSQAPEVSELDKEIAGLEGLMRDLNEITAGDYQI